MAETLLRVAIAATLIGGASSAVAELDDYERQGWTRVFTDEFDGASVDTGAWEVLNRRDSFNDEKQYYHPNQVSVLDGHLRLTAVDQPLGGKDYRSGLVRTHTEWSYGRFEVSGDLPTTQGMWPAIWLLPRFADWPTGGEIDILENRGSQPTLTSSAYHWQEDPNIPCCGAHQYVFDEYTATEGGQPVNFHEGYHEYAVEWEPDVLRFYVDGNRHFTVTSDTAPIFDTAKSLILNLAVGGFFGGDPDGSTSFPQHFDIDYVRVWQRENGFYGLVNGGFDEDGGSLNDWQTFNNSGTNIAAVDSNTVTGQSALRLASEPGGAAFAGLYQGVAVDGGETLRVRASSLVAPGDGFSADGVASVKVEFYSAFGGEYGSGDFLGETIVDIATAATPTGEWLPTDFLVDVPASAVEARYTAILLEDAAAQGAVTLDALSLVSVDATPGDFNLDGSVDAADYTVWRDTLDSTTNLLADSDRNGVVDAADLSAWRSNYGFQGGGLSVPEPSAALLALATIVAPTLRSRGVTK